MRFGRKAKRCNSSSRPPEGAASTASAALRLPGSAFAGSGLVRCSEAALRSRSEPPGSGGGRWLLFWAIRWRLSVKKCKGRLARRGAPQTCSTSSSSSCCSSSTSSSSSSSSSINTTRRNRAAGVCHHLNSNRC
ncbi:unnamed protein product [Caretta caretta]